MVSPIVWCIAVIIQSMSRSCGWVPKVFSKEKSVKINKKNEEDFLGKNYINTYRLLGRWCECICVPFSWSRERDRGRVRRALDATLWAGPWITDAAYDARDIRSDAAAKDCLDWRNSKTTNTFPFSKLISKQNFLVAAHTWPRVNEITWKRGIQISAMGMIWKAVLRLTIGNRTKIKKSMHLIWWIFVI